MSPSILADIYLRPGARILCLATHSKLGLTTFSEQLKARAHVSQISVRDIIDGGIIGLPIGDRMPYEMTPSAPPTTVILLHHPQDTHRTLHHYAAALSSYFGPVACFFHNRDDDLDLIIST